MVVVDPGEVVAKDVAVEEAEGELLQQFHPEMEEEPRVRQRGETDGAVESRPVRLQSFGSSRWQAAAKSAQADDHQPLLPSAHVHGKSAMMRRR